VENIVFGSSLFSRLAAFSSSLVASVRNVFASQFSRLVETAVGVILWCLPLAFWSVVIRFVVKHW